MIVLGIDPGPEKSGMVIYDVENKKIISSSDSFRNEPLLYILRNGCMVNPIDNTQLDVSILFIETIESMGLTVGESTLKTMQWVGRFREAWEGTGVLNGGTGSVWLVSRGDEKIFLCGKKTYRDPNTGKLRGVSDAEVNAAVRNKFPPTGGGKRPTVGIKKQPGPLYGVKKHALSALAVVLTGLETMKRG
jgi:hypothetical protein